MGFAMTLLTWLCPFTLIVAALCLPTKGASYNSGLRKSLLQRHDSVIVPQKTDLPTASQLQNLSTSAFRQVGQGPQCACGMEGYCSCDFIFQFMGCIKGVCHNDKCDCSDR